MLRETSSVVALVGPTGVGKSDVAQELAVRRRGIVLSADSMQVYAGMDIGTAKMPPHMRRVEHFGLDLRQPDEPYSAAQYQQYARGVIDQTLAAGLLPIVCGGTGLYLRAALDEMDFPSGEQSDNSVREHYQSYLDERGAQALYALLSERDPQSAELLHPNNSRRVVRALELLDEGGSYAEQARHFRDYRSHYPVAWVALTCERKELYARIDARVDTMLATGLLEEVEALLTADAGSFRRALTAAQAIGYKELVPVIEEGVPLAPAIAAIKQASRRYAKRQLTWFRADPRLRWIDTDGRTPCDIVEEISAILDE